MASDVHDGEGTPDDEAVYGTRIEDAFIALRGTPFLLGPKDWQLIKEWRDARIPVETVLRGIQEAFERRARRGAAGRVNSLAYCEGAIAERWELERRGLVGRRLVAGGEDASGLDVPARLRALEAALLGRLAVPPAAVDPVPPTLGPAQEAAVRKAIEGVRGVAGMPFEEAEEALGKLERALLKAVLRSASDPDQAAIRARVAAALGDPPASSPSVARRTELALERREVRRTFDLPPLTLLDL